MNAVIPLFRKPFAVLCSLALLLTMSACDGDDGPGVPPPVEVNTAQYISSRSDLNELNAALQAAELSSTLEGSGPFTVFAPSNNAFSGVNTDLLTSEDTELLSKILTYHVVQGQSIMAGDISDGQTVTTVQGTDITFSVSDGNVQLGINGMTATVQTTDLETTNGVIHIIDNVMLGVTNTAERAKATSATSTLSTTLGAAGLESTLEGSGPFTVFAPVNDAFSSVDVDELLEEGNSDLLTEILNYHVIAGQEIAAADISDGQTVTTNEGGDLTFAVADDGTVTVNGKTVTTADIQTTNGVIHLIDGPLLETLDVASYATALSSTSALAAAVTDAGLASALSDETSPLTVFAPMNSAFAALDANGDGEVNGDELSGALRERVLQYHVVGEDIPLVGSGISDGDTRPTLDSGQSLTFSADADTLTAVNGAEIMGSVEAAGGNATIHLLGEVLLQSTNIAQRASLDPNLTALVDAVGTANLSGTLGDDNATLTVFAPPNSAFSGLNADAFTGDEGDPGLAADIVGYHAISGSAIAAEDISDGQTAPSVEGTQLSFRAFADGSVTVNGVPVTMADIQARNGVIHVIDGVLLGSLNIAQRATVEPALTTLAEAAGVAGLASGDGSLGDDGETFTVFAPTNDAFSALDLDEVTGDQTLVTDLLQHHVVPQTALTSDDITNNQMVTSLEGVNDNETDNLTFSVASDGSVMVNGVSVTTTDIQTVNGVVHVIDGVLLDELNIVQRAIADPAFSSLQAAVEAADPAVATTLSDESSNYTVFAPTNDAFGTFLGDGSLGDFTEAELATVLQYHALNGTVLSTDLSDGQTATTLEGSDLAFGVNGGVTVNPDDEAASVTMADVAVENGIIHVIDTVLQPGDQSSGNGGNGGS